MTLERTVAGLFRLDDAAWMRHANPWSVILRLTVLPILITAFWSRLWIGGWAAIPVTFGLVWMWFNPRIFPPPQSLDHWTSKGVLGERIWLNRDKVPVPVYHRTTPNILSAISGTGMIFVTWGVLVFDPWQTLFGAMLVYLSKLWFIDRMVWLWHDMQDATEECRGWYHPKK